MFLRILLTILLVLSLCAFKPGIVSDLGVSGWKAPNWTRSVTGVWSPNPALASEETENGDCEAAVPTLNTVAMLVARCTAAQSVEQAHGGTNSLKLTCNAAGGRFYTRWDNNACGLTDGQWYKADVWVYLPSGQSGDFTGLYVANKTGGVVYNSPNVTTTDTWTRIDFVFRPKFAVNDFYIGVQPIPNIADETGWYFYWDDISIKPITASNIFAVRNFGRQVSFSANLTMTVGLSAGVATRYSDANNYVLCWHDGTNLHLDKVVGGTVTSLINTATAYVAGAAIEIRWNGADTAQAWYNGVQVGADQDVSAVPAGNWAGLFGTNSTVQLTNPTWN